MHCSSIIWGPPPLEMGLIANEILDSKSGQKIKLVCGPAALVTSLDMHGFSFSLLALNAEFEVALKSPATALVWPGMRLHQKPKLLKLPATLKINIYRASKNAALAVVITNVCDTLIAAKAALNTLDAKAGDGDTGSTVAGAARSIKLGLSKLPLANTAQTCSALSDHFSRSMGGSSGVLMAIFFAAAGRAARDGQLWQQSLAAGLAKMMEYGGAKQGDRTMVDALAPALTVLNSGGNLVQAAQAARKGADATLGIVRANAGWSSYVSASNLKGVTDPGIEAVALLFERCATLKL